MIQRLNYIGGLSDGLDQRKAYCVQELKITLTDRRSSRQSFVSPTRLVFFSELGCPFQDQAVFI